MQQQVIVPVFSAQDRFLIRQDKKRILKMVMPILNQLIMIQTISIMLRRRKSLLVCLIADNQPEKRIIWFRFKSKI
jgi:hypothetical protein